MINDKMVATVMMGAFLAISASAQKIADRKENQQDRIAQGVKSGQLTAGETAHLEKREANLHKETRTEP